MKKLGQFFFALVVMLLIIYLQPVLFSEQKAAPSQKNSIPTVIHKSLPYHELEATGFAGFVGKNITELEEVLGAPREQIPTALGFDWRVYGDNEEDLVQAGVSDGKIITIVALGHADLLQPFKVGMNLTDIADITTLYSNFSFSYMEKEYELELTEEDMNYRPLVAFNNGTFAILQFNQATGKLLAVRYLNKMQLLQLMPYQLNSGKLPELTLAENVDWESINKASTAQLLELINILRKEDRYKTYQLDDELQAEVGSALSAFLQDPQKILVNPNRLEQWQDQHQQLSFANIFSLTKEEFDRLQPKAGNGQSIHGILMSPAYDVPWLVLMWYGDLVYQENFRHRNDQQAGIVFSQDAMLFYIQEATDGKSEKESGSS